MDIKINNQNEKILGEVIAMRIKKELDNKNTAAQDLIEGLNTSIKCV